MTAWLVSSQFSEWPLEYARVEPRVGSVSPAPPGVQALRAPQSSPSEESESLEQPRMAARKAINSTRAIERVYCATGGTLNPLAETPPGG